MKKQIIGITLAVAGLLLTAQSQAAPITKDSSGTDLTAGTSWIGGNAPTGADVATWDSSSLGASLALGSPASWAGISVSGALSNIDISGAGPLTLGASGIDLSASTVNLLMGMPVALGASQIWTVNTGITLTSSGAISGAGSLTTAGSGTVILASPNSYSGGTVVNGGTLKAGSTNCFGPNNSTIMIAAGGTLDVNGLALGGLNGTSNYSVTVSGAGVGGNGAIVSSSGSQPKALSAVSLNADTTVGGSGPAWGFGNGKLTGNGYNLTKVGGSGVYFGNNALTNLQNININGGYITIQQASTVDNNTPGSIYLNPGGILRLGQYGVAASSLNILKPIVMAGGMLGTDNTGANGNATVAAGVTLNATGNFAPSAASTLTLNGPIVDGTANAVSFSGGVINPPGTTVLTATNTYTGLTTISAGTMVGVVGGSCSNSAVTVAATAANTAVLGVSITDNTKRWTCASLTVNNGGTSSGLLFSFGAVTPSTTVAPLNLTGSVAFTTAPTITITGSSLPASSGNGYPLMTWGSGSAPSLAGVTLTMPFRTGGTLAIVGNTLYLQSSGSTEPLSWAGGNGTWDTNNTGNTIWKDSASVSTYFVNGDAAVFNNTVGSGGTVTLNTIVTPASVTVNNPTADYTISGSGAIAGGIALTKAGSGTLTFSNNNTYTGNTTVSAGTLSLSPAATGFPTVLQSGTITVQNGGTLALFAGAASGIFLYSGTPANLLYVQNGGRLQTDKSFFPGYIQLDTGAQFSFGSGTFLNPRVTDGARKTMVIGSVTIPANGVVLYPGIATSANTQTLQFDGTGTGASIPNVVLQNGATTVGGTNNYVFDIAHSPAAVVDLNLTGGIGGQADGTRTQRITKQGSGVMSVGDILTTPQNYDMIVNGGTFICNKNATTRNFKSLTVNSGTAQYNAGNSGGVGDGLTPVMVAATSGKVATLAISVLNNTYSYGFDCGSVTVNNGGTNSGLQFNFGAVTPSTTAAPLYVEGNATFTTAPAITVTGSSLPASTGDGYPLVSWGGSGPADITGMTLTLPSRLVGNLAVVGNTLYLQITGTTGPISWAGGNGTWDINNSGNLIWKDNTNASTYYQEIAGSGDSLQFDNTVGSGGTVTLNTTVSPGNITVNNPTANYTISGSGSIAGSGVLTKAGAGTLTLATANTRSGATTVNGGTLALSGSGALATNTAITINGGTLDMGAQDAVNDLGNNTGIVFGTSGGNLNGSGTLKIIGLNASAAAFSVAANATAVVNENLFATNTLANSFQTLASVGSGATLTLNGQVNSHYSGNGIWTSGGGTLVLNNPSGNYSVLGIQGTGATVSTPYFSALGTQSHMVMGQSPANGPATLIYTGAAVTNSFFFLPATLTPTILNNGSGTVTFTGGNFTQPYGNPSSGTHQTLTLGGVSDMSIKGVIQDAKASNSYLTDLVKTNGNTITLAGNNTYSGSTTISAGTLLGVTGGSCSNSAVTLAAAAGNTAVVGVSITDNTMQWTIPGLTVNNSGTSSDLQFSFVVPPGTTVAAMNIVGNATLTTTPGITITGSTLPVSSGNGYPLMTWGGSGPATTSGITLTLPPGAVGNLAIVGSTLYLQVTVGIVPTPPVPVFSPAGGAYYGALAVTISSEAGSTIHYTTDGSDPTTSGSVLTGISPVIVNVPVNVLNETIRAYASLTGAPADSAVSTQSYNTTLPASFAAQPMVAGSNDASTRNDFTGTVGYTFTNAAKPIMVTALGYADWTTLGMSGPGLNTSHIVSLWDGSGTLIASVTVPAGTAGNYAGGYWYATLNSPVTMAANANYTIGASQVSGGDFWPSSLGTYFPGFSAPVFTGMVALSDANAVYGASYPAPPTSYDTVGSSVWLTCNLQGSPAAAVVNQPVKLVNGSVQFSALGAYGAGYRIWATTNLALTPITSTWSNVSSGTFNGSSIIYTDTAATNYPARFYIITIP